MFLATFLVLTLISCLGDPSWITTNQLFQSQIADEELQVQWDSIDLEQQ